MFRAFKRLLPVSDGDDDDDDLPVGGRGEAAGPNQGFSAAPPAKKRTALEILTLLSSTPSPSGTESSVDSNVNQPSLSNVKRKQLGGGGRRLGLHGGSTVPSAKTESINKEISCERETDIYGALEDDLSPCPTVSSSAETANATGVERRVFDVLWCKASKKKHKNWEGDAFLTVEGRSAFLKDMSGKEIGRCIGYKVAQLAELTEGSRLLVGGKEVELMSERSVPASTVEVESGTSDSLRRHAQKPLRPLQNASGGRRPMGGSYLRAGLSTSRAPSSLTAVGSGRIPAFTAPQRTDEGGKEEAQEEEEFVLCPPPAHLCYRDSNSQPRTVTVDRHLSRSLRPHQKEGLRFLYNVMAGFIPEVRGAILADEMGLGKTLQTIALIWTLLRQGPYGSPLVQRALVIAPSGLLKNWSNEFNKWLGRERILVHLVSQNVKPSRLVLTPSVPVMLISYEMALKYVQDLETFNFDLIVCDEGHRLKNANVKIFAALSSLRCRRRLVLTGTPVQNDIREFFTLVDFVNPGILQSLNMPRSALESCLRNPVSADGGSGAEDDTDEDENESCRHKLSRLVSSFLLRRTLESTLGNQLPPRTVAVVFCHPSPLQSNLYQAVLDSRESQVIQNMDVGVSSGNVLRILTLLKKLCNHPILINSECLEGVSFPSSFNQSFPRPNDSGKLVALCRLLDFLFISPEKPEPPPERIVLVSNYTKTLDVLESICQSKGLSSLRLDGTTPIADRQKLVDRFNDPASRDHVFLLSCKAGGVGLNLIGASRLVLFDIDWNPANDLQAMARIWRDGQKKHVFIYRFLTTGTIEERIFQRQLMKGALSGLVENTVSRGSVNSLEQCLLEKPHFGLDTSPKFSQDELKDLFSLVSDSNCLTHDLMDCQCSTKAGSASKISRSRLDQLMDWKHLESTDVEVSHLGLESEQVSFVMLNHQTI